MKKTLFTFPMDVLKSVRDFAKKRQEDLEGKIKNLNKEDPFNDNERLSNNSEGDDVNEQIDHQRVDAIRTELEKNLSDTKNALSKIDKGEYGFCENCGNLIDTSRLEVNPLALFCLRCEEKRSV
jgi:RNA polymerase-binding transcription factor DksA